MPDIEQELVKAIRFKKKPHNYADHQDYLASLTVALEKLPDDDYDNLSDGAADWYQAAINAMNKKQPIPDFEGAEVAEPEDAPEIEEPEEPEEAAEETEDTEAEEPEDEEADDAEGADTDEPVAEEPEPDAEPVARGKPKKAPKEKVQEKVKPKVVKTPKDYLELTGEKDRFGVVLGTKTHEAVKMYVKGCTQSQIVETLGSRYYNILRRLTKEGHRVEKLPGNVWKLTHRDDVTKKKGK